MLEAVIGDVQGGDTQVLGLDHVLLDAFHECFAAASGANATSTALDAQVLEQEALEHVVESIGIHDCLSQRDIPPRQHIKLQVP